jgi:hypothetical protein
VAADCLGTGPYISATSEHSNEHLRFINITRNITPFHHLKLSFQQMPSHKFVTFLLGTNPVQAGTKNGLFTICGRKSDTGARFLSEPRSYRANFLPIFHYSR